MTSAQIDKFLSVKPAEIEWQDKLPFSLEFNDVYFSIHGAIEESEHVFINGNQLNHHWKSKKQTNYYIAELGFGSGLNFLNTLKHWAAQLSIHSSASESGSRAESESKSQVQPHHLHYIAFEKRPFHLDDFKKVAKLWPELSVFSNQLIKHYPSLIYGKHQIHFKQWNVTLTLMLMPVNDALDNLVAESESQNNKIKIDYWYLDGFSPCKNPQMWGEENAIKIAKLSKVGTSLATYSVAGSVKKPLQEAGFKIVKSKGFAKKREMLTAKLIQINRVKNKFINIKYEKPWFNISKNISGNKNNHPKVAIIGAGLAGCTTAYSLAKKGFHCTIYDVNEKIAQGGSGAAAGIFHPQLTSDLNLASQFSWQSYLTLVNFLSQLTQQQKNKIILSQGVERILENIQTKDKILQLSQTLGLSDWLIENTSFSKSNESVYFPHSAAIDIPKYCQLLLDLVSQKQLSVKNNHPINKLDSEKNGWLITTNEKQHFYSDIIYCGGAKSPLLKTFNLDHTNTTRGQSCFVNAKELSHKIDHTLYEKSYIVPLENNQLHLGSTFEAFNTESLEADNFVDYGFKGKQLNQQSQNTILQQSSTLLKKLSLPYWSQNKINSIPLQGTVGYRLHSDDRFPIVGAAINKEKLLKEFTQYTQTRLLREKISEYNLKGLWLNTAYGSHGLLYSLLASQHLTSLLTNKISPLTHQLSNAVHPARFVMKQLKK